MSAAVAAPPPLPEGSTTSTPIITCPYTAGTCPLFHPLGLPATAPGCTGSCSSPAPTPSAVPTPSTSAAGSTPSSAAATPLTAPSRASYSARTSSTSIGYDDALLFSELQSDVPLPLPSALLKQDAWASYLDFAVSPGQVELGSTSSTGYFAPALPLPAPSPLASTSSSNVASSSCAGTAPGLTTTTKHSLWDIEELVPSDSQHGYKRTRLTPPPQQQRSAYGGDINVGSGLGLGYAPQEAVPHSPAPSSDEEKEVVTPFISKLTYLLEHEEYRPWVRWDATGNHILIAHTKPHLLEVLARYFRHTTVASFVRQLNIYGFKRASTSSLLSILDTVSIPSAIPIPGHPHEIETFSAADYSAFSNPAFFRSVSGPGGRHCRLGALKPITKERGPRNRGKKTQRKKAGSEDDSA
ncbi:hypothetical protein JCM8097_000680 [Rhodosporidiobolus ruineniae]